MKITILALTAFVLATAPLAWAQEDASTPAPAPEAAAPETAESPATSPSVSVSTEKSAPAAEKSSSPAAKKSSSSDAPKKSASPSATKSATKTSAVMPTKKSTPEATLRDIEDKWETSFMAHDPSVAKAYLADDYRGVSSKGKVMNKSTLLAEIKNDTDTYTSAKNGNMDVRVFGGQFAVVMGTSTEAGKGKDGKAFKRNFRWTDAWVLRKDTWQCVASQSMQLAK
jgi:ketosteroid isomerase-like protein